MTFNPDHWCIRCGQQGHRSHACPLQAATRFVAESWSDAARRAPRARPGRPAA